MTPTERDEFQTLLDALCEESISPEQHARLEELVLAHPEAEAPLRPVHFARGRHDLALRLGAGPDGTVAEGARPICRDVGRIGQSDGGKELAATVDGRRGGVGRVHSVGDRSMAASNCRSRREATIPPSPRTTRSPSSCKLTRPSGRTPACRHGPAACCRPAGWS